MSPPMPAVIVIRLKEALARNRIQVGKEPVGAGFHGLFLPSPAGAICICFHSMPTKVFHIVVNGESRPVAEGTTAQELLVELGLGGGKLALELNCRVLPRGQWSSRFLAQGDRIEVVRAIGGG